MKKSLITVAVLFLLYPIGSWLMGFAIEQRIDGLADQEQLMVPRLRLIDKTRHGVLTSDGDSSYELGSTLRVTRHYHRGWFRSVDDATVEVSRAALDALPALKPAASTTGSDGSEAAPFRFSLRTEIHHGPICGWTCFALAGAEAHVTFTGPLQASLTRLFGNREPITVRTRLAFFGGGSATMSSPAFELAQIGKDAHLNWGGLDGTMHYGTRQDWYDITAAAPSLRVDGAQGTLQVDGMSLGARAKRVLRTLYDGDSRVEVKHLRMTGADKSRHVTIEDMLFVNQSHAQDHFMSVNYQLGAGEIVTPPLTLSSEHVDLTWKHLRVESLEALTTAMHAASQGTNAARSV